LELIAKIESGLVWSLLPCSITQSSQEQIISTLLARCLGMMPPKVVAVLLLLLLSVTISLHHATGECTETQKEAIIENCKVYIRKVAPPHKIPAHNSYCCIKVRDVPERDMECIYGLLTDPEKELNSEQRILNLKVFCKPVPVKKNLIHFI